MKHKISILIFIPLLLIFAFYSCKENLVTSDEESDLKYPTILYPLSEEKIQQLQNEFDTLNDYKICSKINKYGFIGNDRYNRVYQNVPIDRDSALILAINTLLKNSKYVNIKDSATLISNGYNIIQGNAESTRWKIIFGPQIYNGFELPFTWLHIWIYGNEPYAITGHWYSNIYIPSKYKIDTEKAKEKVAGQKIIWYDIAGNPQEYIVTDESISADISKTIYPVEKGSSIELRVTWKIPIKFFSNDVGWHIYLDVMDGEIVNIVQEFVT